MIRLQDLVDKIKAEMDPAKVGMIVCHNGVVRATSRKGEPAEYLEIGVDSAAWNQVLEEGRREPGISHVEAVLFTGRREVGEDVLLVAVAGDIRENVFPVLEKTVNRLKKEAVVKKEALLEKERAVGRDH
ncbi:MAG TPA: molybdenum cofactor biosynthesis protein MoaE [Syntrophobacteraceae bacterium]|nr:molybdenum cofactor biosynthesis protein MoaE [Syntrophobacteraceae bacterium]